MNNMLKIVCVVLMYASCLFGVNQGLLPKNSEIIGLVFLAGAFCMGDAILAFKSSDKKSGFMYILSAMAIVSFGLYFVFLT